MVVVGIHGLAEIYGLWQCFGFTRDQPNSSSSSPSNDAPEKKGTDILLLSELADGTQVTDVRVERSSNNNNTLRGNFCRTLQDVFCLPRASDKGDIDDRFLKMLLRNADEDAADKLCDFGEGRFRDQLEEVVTCLQWPYSKIKERLMPDDEHDKHDPNSCFSLALADVNLLTLPPALLRAGEVGWRLVTLDLSFNENLVDFDENVLQVFGSSMATLKCRNCGIVNVGPIFRRLKRLRFLDISYNKIRSITDLNDAVDLKELRSLLVIGNPFRGGGGGVEGGSWR